MDIDNINDIAPGVYTQGLREHKKYVQKLQNSNPEYFQPR